MTGGWGHNSKMRRLGLAKVMETPRNSPNVSNGRWQREAFEVFWSQYPMHRARVDAWKAWQQLQPEPALVIRILGAVNKQKYCKQWRAGFIPYPATWLRGERWDDELVDGDFLRAKL
jgi:hypothetical protein